MRTKKNLLKPAVLLSTVCLFLAAGGTAEAAELLGIHASDDDDTGDTSTILLIDTALGTSIELADTGLSRVAEGTDSDAVNGLPGPNGLAYDIGSGKAYFASAPNSGGGPLILYSVVVSPPDGLPPVNLGTPTGTRLFDAAFFDGKYWYIDANTDDLRSISFAPDGTIASDVVEADLLAGSEFDGDTFGFGDIAIQDSTLYGAGRRKPGGGVGDPIVFFTVDLSSLPNYTEHQTDDPATPPLQLAFGGEGTLFGQTGALTGEQDLYYVSLVPATLGERGKVLTDFSGGPYTDMSDFNPLCDCDQGFVLLILDERSIDNDGEYLDSNGDLKEFTEAQVDDGSPALGKRTPLPFFSDPANIGTNITLFTGQVGGEAWHALKTIPDSWTAAGPTADGLRNYMGNPTVAFPHNVGPGLGNPDNLLDPVPDVTPLRATGLQLLEGKTVCGILMESSVSTNYAPLQANLKGEYQGTVAFFVVEATNNLPDLPKVEITVLDPAVACELEPQLFTEAPVLVDSSTPFDNSL